MIRAVSLLSILLATTAGAEAPKVVTDIAPVQSIVARVMGDLGQPKSLIAAGVSPHNYSMRPSEAAALQEADLVVWIGSALTPQLDSSIDSLGENATVLSLMEVPEIRLLEYRELSEFGDHGHDEDHHDDHAEDKHGDDHHGEEHHSDEHHSEDEHAEHEHGEEGHGEDKHAEKGHDDQAGGHDHHDHHGELDPHIWLDPMNAALAMQSVATVLAEKDPENATIYLENARAGAAELEALNEDIKARLSGVEGQSFLVYHDAFHYFESRYGLAASGSIAVGDASSPGPARLKQVRKILVESGATCVFAEPQHPEKLTTVVIEGTDVRSRVIDPLGAGLTPGAGLYPALLTQLADNIASCLVPET
ncbi:MAG: zinc ABC transporter substrate-binding protein [Pseudomonadota bacterium]